MKTRFTNYIIVKHNYYSLGASHGGVSFIRWGRTTCPSTNGTQLVYAGTTAGSNRHEGGTSTYLCLHPQAQYLPFTPGRQDRRAYIFGTKYEAFENPPAFVNMGNHNAPCSVCHTPTRNTRIIIPGRITCPVSWTREYYGYLMNDGWYLEQKGKVPACVDVHAESVPGSAGGDPLSLLYFIETVCAGITCPPYIGGAELSCVVCTR